MLFLPVEAQEIVVDELVVTAVSFIETPWSAPKHPCAAERANDIGTGRNRKAERASERAMGRDRRTAGVPTAVTGSRQSPLQVTTARRDRACGGGLL